MLFGYTTADEAIADPDILALLTRTMALEAAPLLTPPVGHSTWRNISVR